MGALRLELAKKFADKHGLFAQTGTAKDFRFLWVTDFPMYEWNEETKQWDAAHHPFTSPHEEDIKSGALWNDKGAVRALAYDVVLNGRSWVRGRSVFIARMCSRRSSARWE